MMISTKGRYALQVMLDLAQQCPDAYISLHDISQRQAVSMKYLEAIVAMLNKAGMVESRRGKSGRTAFWRVCAARAAVTA